MNSDVVNLVFGAAGVLTMAMALKVCVLVLSDTSLSRAMSIVYALCCFATFVGGVYIAFFSLLSAAITLSAIFGIHLIRLQRRKPDIVVRPLLSDTLSPAAAALMSELSVNASSSVRTADESLIELEETFSDSPSRNEKGA